MMGVVAQAFANEAQTSLCIQVLQRWSSADKSSRAFASERRTGGQGERKTQHAPFPTHLGGA
jgi:hypothetical protein